MEDFRVGHQEKISISLCDLFFSVDMYIITSNTLYITSFLPVSLYKKWRSSRTEVVFMANQEKELEVHPPYQRKLSSAAYL